MDRKLAERVGIDEKQVQAIFGGNESFYMRMLKKFPADGSYGDLAACWERGDYEGCFRAVHTLKGVCANLGLESLLVYANPLTECLRKQPYDLEQAGTLMEQLKPAYAAVTAEIERL